MPTQESLDRAFAVLETAAVKGERCPENHCFGGGSTVPDLARAGKIKIEIYWHNYRRVTILTGQNTGKATAPHPKGMKPWKMIDASGTRTSRGKFSVPVARQARVQPSAPRPLSRDELA